MGSNSLIVQSAGAAATQLLGPIKADSIKAEAEADTEAE